LPHTTHLHDISRSVKILRERHPFEGRSLVVMSALKRRGILLLLVVLPDRSRSLIPASWTDWAGTAEDGAPSRPEHHDSDLASLADLLHARGIIDALLGRCLIPPQVPAADEESCDATDPGLSRIINTNIETINTETINTDTINTDTISAVAIGTEPTVPRRRSARRGSQHSGTHHRASHRDTEPNGGER
jgi:hypothetical protein